MRDWFSQVLHNVAANLIATAIWPVILAALAMVVTAALGLWYSPGAAAILAAALGSGAFVVLLSNQIRVTVREARKEMTGLHGRSESAPELSEKQREMVQTLVEFYDQQRRVWPSYAHLELLRVDCAHINEASPYVVLSLIIRNLLLAPLKLIRVMNSDGTVGAHTLPSLPENYNVQVSACQQHMFQVKLFLYGQVPDHLRSEAWAECPRALRWAFRGEWWVEVYGEDQVAWPRSYDISCESVPVVPR